MAEPAPIRPQRIIRANREITGGLLMSVIRSLTTSRDSADRDRERLELEKGFQQCDAKLNELISQHGNDLYKVMTIFSTILTNLSRAKERLIDTRDKLLNCQKLLHCKREELKKLWLEIIENRAVFNLLERIERVSALPRQVESYADKKHYLHAGKCCVDGLRQLGCSESSPCLSSVGELDPSSTTTNGFQSPSSAMGNNQFDFSLGKIEALTEVRQELLTKKEMLFDKCIEELHRHLYSITTENVRKQFQNEQQQRQIRETSNSNQNHKPSVIYDNLRLYENQMIKTDQQQQSQSTAIQDENDFDAYPEEDSRQFISMLTKCIGLLNKIPDAVKIIKERFDEEFVNVVIRTAQDILISNQNDSIVDSLAAANNTDSMSLMDLDADGIPDVSSMAVVNSTPTPNTGQDLVVLTCTRLLGYRYNGFSHLQSSANDRSYNQLQWPRTSLQLRQLFDMLIQQFYHIMELHDTVILINLKRIDSALHLAAMADNMTIQDPNDVDSNSMAVNTAFYSSIDIWSKIQLLIQQLLDYYLDISQISGQASSTGPIGGAMNYNLVSSLLPSAAVNMLFGLNSAGTTTSVTSSGPVGSGCPDNLSCFFIKRRPMVVAGAMNAVMMMSKNTSNFSNTAAASGSGGQTTGTMDQSDSGTGQSTNVISTVSSGTMSNQSGTLQPVSSGHNLLHSFSQSHWRSNQSNLFKFDHSTQAISWNSFLQQQQRQSETTNADQQGENISTNTDQTDSDNKSANQQQQTSAVNNNINHRLFDSLRSICHQSPDNLVLLHDTLLEHVHKCPLTTASNNNTDSGNSKQQQINILHSYLMSSSEKFTRHINTQLDAMLEQAQKSLESGVTILLQQPVSQTDQSSNAQRSKQSPQNKDKISGSSDSSDQQSPMTPSGPTITIGPGHNVTLLLLESAVLVDVAVHDLSMLMGAMTEYRQHYLGYICNVLTAYKDSCTRLYDTVTTEMIHQPSMTSTLTTNQSLMGGVSNLDLSESSHTSTMLTNSDQRRSILSAYCAHNEDINRLLKSQPNWIQLEMVNQRIRTTASGRTTPSSLIKSHQRYGGVGNAPARRQMMMINRQMSTSMSFDVESPEDVRQRNASEIDILIKMLSQEITQSELLWNQGQLTLLANMQQSFEWLAVRCDHLVQMIQSQSSGSSSSNRRNRMGLSNDSSDVIIATLNQLSVDFEELGQLCLMVLHLEIRVHCCYHLQALDAQFFTTPVPSTMMSTSDHSYSGNRSSNATNSTSTDLSDDGRIMPLLEDLQRMHSEISAAQLSTSKMGYLFEGLGHLMATKFINSAMAVKRVKPNGIKRACRAIYDIQRRLSTLTKSRELALDYARQYFEMLLLTPEEIFSTIIERGRQFKPQEYISAITLLHQSGLSQTGSETGVNTIMANTTTSAASNSLDQHQSNQQLQRLIKRLNHILAEVIS
ncbi:Exocyst complex component 4 [Dermatophagoides farinae]|uniref:Exocyst complex component Sec8 n=1 Tax=Dermatophagoides farinae TaxID=6954 RepID=A0A922L5E5_DERFA|nr:Exocyst complex component 4 [Dermatophagoides farinae]